MQAALDIPNPLWHPGNIDQFRGQALPYRRVRPGRRPICHRLVTASRAWNGVIQPLLGISATSIPVRPVAFQLWADRCPTSCFRGARCPSQYTRSAERRETHKPVLRVSIQSYLHRGHVITRSSWPKPNPVLIQSLDLIERSVQHIIWPETLVRQAISHGLPPIAAISIGSYGCQTNHRP